MKNERERKRQQKKMCALFLVLTILVTSLGNTAFLQNVQAASEATWSEWSEQEPEHLKTRKIEVKTQYRYRDKEVQQLQSASETYNGYTLDSAAGVTYGEETYHGTTPVTASDTLRVDVRKVFDHYEYLMAHYCTGNVSGAKYQTCPSNNSTNSVFNANCTYHEIGWFHEDSGDFYYYDSNGYLYAGSDTSSCYRCVNTCYKWYRVDSRNVYLDYYYSYPIYHTYYKWSEWSDWEDKEYESNELREVETRTLYRYADFEGTINMCDISINPGEETFVYNGTERKPGVTVYDAAKKLLTEGTDYQISYSNNINAGTAYVNVEGIGEYDGIQALSFTITKAEPTFTFENKSVVKKANAKPFCNTVSSNSDGIFTYTSEDTSVATVDSASGMVTPKAMGNTKIHLTAAEGSNVKGGTAYYTLNLTEPKADPATLESLSFSFPNFGGSIGEDSWFGIFGNTSFAKSMLLIHPKAGQGGHCYGMAAVAGMCNVYGSGVSVDQFAKKSIGEIGKEDYSLELAVNMQDLIKLLFVSQYSSVVQRAYAYNTDLDEVCAKVKEAEQEGQPVILGVFNGASGHALVAYKYEDISATKARIYVYDCNWPNRDKYIELTKDGENYTNWTYDIGGTIGIWQKAYGRIAYIPYETYQSLWADRGFVTSVLPAGTNVMIANSGSYDVKDYKGNVVASVRDGKLVSNAQDVYQFQSMGILEDAAEEQENEIMLYLPTDPYVIENKDDNIFELEVTCANVEQSSKVSTTADEVMITIDDEEQINQVLVNSDQLDVYEIEMDMSNADGSVSKSTSVSGVVSETCSASVGFAGGELSMVTGNFETGDIMEGVVTDNNTGTTPDGKPVKAIDSLTISLEYESADYDGSAKKPAVTIKDGTTSLVENKDFFVRYINTKEIGTASLKIYGVGAYKGSVVKNYQILDPDKKNDKPEQGDDEEKPQDKEETEKPKDEVKDDVVSLDKVTVESVANKQKGIAITWKKVTNADSYKIYRKAGKKAYKLLATVKGKTQYLDKSVKAKETYQYKLVACKGNVNSADSKASKIIRIAQPKKPNVKASKDGISITWKKTQGAKGYYVLRKTAKGKWKKIATTKKLSYIDKKAKKKQKYYYAVQAYSGKYVSSYVSSKAVKR